MNEQDIINFRNSLCDLSLEELQAKQAELQECIVKMVLDSDMVMKIAILENCIKEKING